MGIAKDLLRQAEGLNPSQASLRRAVSTAYYAASNSLYLRPSGKLQARSWIYEMSVMRQITTTTSGGLRWT
jgi:hypothetical protein